MTEEDLVAIDNAATEAEHRLREAAELERIDAMRVEEGDHDGRPMGVELIRKLASDALDQFVSVSAERGSPVKLPARPPRHPKEPKGMRADTALRFRQLHAVRPKL